MGLKLKEAVSNKRYGELLDTVRQLSPRTILDWDERIQRDLPGSFKLTLNSHVDSLRQASIVNRRYGGVFDETEMCDGRGVYGGRLRVLAFYHMMTSQTGDKTSEVPDHK